MWTDLYIEHLSTTRSVSQAAELMSDFGFASSTFNFYSISILFQLIVQFWQKVFCLVTLKSCHLCQSEVM